MSDIPTPPGPVFTLEAKTPQGFVGQYMLLPTGQWVVAGNPEFYALAQQLIRDLVPKLAGSAEENVMVGVKEDVGRLLPAHEGEDCAKDGAARHPSKRHDDLLSFYQRFGFIYEGGHLPDIVITAVDIANRQEELTAIGTLN